MELPGRAVAGALAAHFAADPDAWDAEVPSGATKSARKGGRGSEFYTGLVLGCIEADFCNQIFV